MKFSSVILGYFALAFAASSDAQPMDESGFTVTYEWKSGSVPPPFHWQYRIRLRGQGTGDIVMVPGYPDIYDDLPRWRVTFSATNDQLTALRKLIDDDNFFMRTWQADERRGADGVSHSTSPEQGSLPPPPPGSEICTLRVTELIGGGAASALIPCGASYLLAPSDATRRDRIIKMIIDLVPNQEWERLNTMREKYVQTHPNHPS